MSDNNSEFENMLEEGSQLIYANDEYIATASIAISAKRIREALEKQNEIIKRISMLLEQVLDSMP